MNVPAPAGDVIEEQQDEVQEFEAGCNVNRLGLVCVLPPPRPPDALLVKQVAPETWADDAGIEVGSTLLALNGANAAGLSAPEIKKAMAERPLRLRLAKPRAPEWRRVSHFQKDAVRLTLRVSKLQTALQQEHSRLLQLEQGENHIDSAVRESEEDPLEWWAASRTRLQDELFRAQNQLKRATLETETALKTAEDHYRRQVDELEIACKKHEVSALETFEKERAELQSQLHEVREQCNELQAQILQCGKQQKDVLDADSEADALRKEAELSAKRIVDVEADALRSAESCKSLQEALLRTESKLRFSSWASLASGGRPMDGKDDPSARSQTSAGFYEF